MEKTMSVEDKIKRAEAIYNKRKENQTKKNTTKVSVNNKKDIKLLKKMIIQIIVCLLIYSGYYLVVNNNYIISEDLKNKTKEVLSQDINFEQWYSYIIEKIKGLYSTSQEETENTEEDTTSEEENITEEGIGGAEDEISIEQETTEDTSSLSQTEQDVLDIKNTISFIQPITGTITSTFGWRNPTTSTVPKYHTGLDIAATSGTVIKSATDGEVILASSEGDYGNHLKIQIYDVVIIYAHCKTLYVNQGDIITQGQEIAEVGSTGNSTGPHLHFEIRKEDRLVDPQLILEI